MRRVKSSFKRNRRIDPFIKVSRENISTGPSLLETVLRTYGMTDDDVYLENLEGEDRYVSSPQDYGAPTYRKRMGCRHQVVVEVHEEPQERQQDVYVPKSPIVKPKGTGVKDSNIGFQESSLVDPKSGVPAFKLTIFSIPGYTFSLHYNSSGQAYISNMEVLSNEVAFDWAFNRAKIVAHRLCSGISQERMFLYLGGQVYTLRAVEDPSGGALIEYMIASQPTWKMTYDPEGQKWKLMFGDGRSFVFGSSNLNDNALENCLIANKKYLGPVTGGDEQNEQVPMVWNMTQHLDKRGEPLVTFTYKEDSFVPSSGGGTLSVTRGTYLESAVSKTGERIEFVYKEKTGEENSDSHQYHPNLYQDRWYSWYLSEAHLYDADGTLQGTAIFDSMVLFPMREDGAPSVWVSPLCKRLLTGVRFFNGKGYPLPGNPTFSYYGMDPNDGCLIEVDSKGAYTYKDVDVEAGAVYGAMRTYTTAKGVTHTFEYDTVFLSDRVQKHEPTGTKVTRAKSYRNTVVVIMSPDGKNPPITLAVYEWDGKWRPVTLKEYEIFYTMDFVMDDYLAVGENFIVFNMGAKEGYVQGESIALLRDRQKRATFTEQILESTPSHFLTNFTVGTNMVGAVYAESVTLIGNKYFKVWNYNGKELVLAVDSSLSDQVHVLDQPQLYLRRNMAMSSYDNMMAIAEGVPDLSSGTVNVSHTLITRDSLGSITRKDSQSTVKTTGMYPTQVFDAYFKLAPYYSVYFLPMSDGLSASAHRVYVQAMVTHWDSDYNFDMEGLVAMDQSQEHQGEAYWVKVDSVVTPDSCVAWVSAQTDYTNRGGEDHYLNSVFTIMYDPLRNYMHRDIRPCFSSSLTTASRVLAPNAWGGVEVDPWGPPIATYYAWDYKGMTWDSILFNL